MQLKKIIMSVFLTSIMIFTASCNKSDKDIKNEIPDVSGIFQIEFLDVGKADAIILRTEKHTVIVDCGNKGDGKYILEELSEMGVNKIDYMFVTHFDKDHVGGCRKVINNIGIDKIVIPDYEGNCDEYFEFKKAAEEKRIPVEKITKNNSFILDDVYFEVFPPLKKKYNESDNNYSLALSVIHGKNKFLLTGDAEEERLNEILSQTDMEYQVLKVPHHGKKADNSKRFFESIKPLYAVITSSDEEPADVEVTEILNDMNCEIYNTKNGKVTLKSDGENLKFVQKESMEVE